MKKIFISLILAGLFSFVSATGPSYTGSNVYVSKTVLTVSTLDTIVSASDSQIISSSFTPEAQPWRYFLVNKNFTGGASDSVALQIWAICYKSDGTVKSQQLIDSIVVAYSKPILLPINNGLFGAYYKIYAKGFTGIGGELITNGWCIEAQQPLAIEKKTW